VTDTRDEFGDLFALYLVVVVAVAVIVFALVLFALARYRSRGNDTPVRARSNHPVAESVYAALLALIAAVLVAATFRTENRIDRVAPGPKLTIAITAFQWGWRFDYPDQQNYSLEGNDRARPTLVVPTATTIRFTATSRDVIHSFWIPRERFKRDAFPGRTTTFDLVFDRPGRFSGRCAEFCGLRHGDMEFDVLAVPRARFETELLRAGRST
jgi:cytochrome c oxidase subunit II